MRRGMWLFCLGFGLCLLAGCSAWLGGGYASVTPHAEAYAQTDPADTETASDYQQLRQVLIHLVENYVDQASVDVTRYGDELEGDLDRSIQWVRENNPVVAYAVQDIQAEAAEVGARRSVSVSISYRRTQEELQAVQPTLGGSGVEDKVSGALERAEAEITLQVSGYQPMDLEAFVQTYYQEHLDTVMECPEVSVQLYPKQGSTRIMEIQFQYTNSRETLLQMKQNVQVLLNSALGYVEGQASEQLKAERLYAFLRPLFVQTGPSATPVYSLLCVGVGDSRSMAMVYGLLCRQAGLDCRVVSGTSSGRQWYWNIVELDGRYCHVDLLTDLEGDQLVLRYDEDMTDYVWNTKNYPACPKPEPPATEPEGETTEPAESEPEETVEAQTPPEPLPEEPTQPEQTEEGAQTEPE